MPVRKAGKLPFEIEREEYVLEYGTDLLEIHRDAILPGEHVLIVDDVIANGRDCGGNGAIGRAARRDRRGVCCSCSSCSELGGRAQLPGQRVHAALQYE